LNRHDRGGEHIERERFARDRGPDTVKGTRVVHPVQVPEEALLAEHQLLTAGAYHVSRVAEFAIGHPQVERVAKGDRHSTARLVEDAGILRLHDELRERADCNRDVETESIEHVAIAVVRLESATGKALEPPAEFAADSQPLIQLPIGAKRRGCDRPRHRCDPLRVRL
jgi:hypothetical protein